MNGFFAVAEHRHTSARTGAARAIGTAVLDIVGRVMAARNRARTLRILSGLDDASLKDIGIARGHIEAIERDPRYTPKFPGF